MFTKRLLGLLAVAAGGIGLVGILLLDTLGITDPGGGFGPSQQAGAAAAVLTIIIGLTLIPLGNEPV
jgi:hypothetical protein